MLDNTPVLDIKPYIPLYDNPTATSQLRNAEMQLSVDVGDSDSELIDQSCIPREAPDGEEDGSSNDRAPSTSVHVSDQVISSYFCINSRMNNWSLL